MTDTKTCKQGHVGMYSADGRCNQCRRERRQQIPRRRAERFNGAQCYKCGGTERYVSNHSCVYCSCDGKQQQEKPNPVLMRPVTLRNGITVEIPRPDYVPAINKPWQGITA